MRAAEDGGSFQAPAPTVPPPRRCVTLASLAGQSGGEWLSADRPNAMETTAPPSAATRLVYSLPSHASAEVLAYLRSLATVDAPAQAIARLAAARVAADGVVLSADGERLARDVSADFGKPFDQHWLLGHGRLRPPEILPGVSALAAVHLGAGYCHWLLEELPRLLSLPVGMADNLITHGATSFAREALSWRGGGERIVTPRRSTHFACTPLLVPALAARAGEPTPDALARIVAFAESLERNTGACVAANGSERIYVSRALARRRRVANDAELAAFLVARGFREVRLEELGWREQIALFRAATVVVGPHGAGLANLVFCTPGTRVVELVGRAYFNPTFWRVAALRGLDYRPVLGRAARGEEDGPVREDHRANREDIVADLVGVRAALGD